MDCFFISERGICMHDFFPHRILCMIPGTLFNYDSLFYWSITTYVFVCDVSVSGHLNLNTYVDVCVCRSGFYCECYDLNLYNYFTVIIVRARHKHFFIFLWLLSLFLKWKLVNSSYTLIALYIYQWRYNKWDF